MKRVKVLSLLLLISLIGLFLFTGPLDTVGAKNKLVLKDSKFRNGGLDYKYKLSYTNPLNNPQSKDTKTAKIPIERDYRKLLPRLGETKKVWDINLETIQDPKTGELLTVAADYILVKYKKDLYLQNKGKAVYNKIETINKKYNTQIIKSSPYRGSYEKVSIPRGETKISLIDKMNKDTNIVFAELDPVRLPFWTPNDPYYSGSGTYPRGQWYIQNFIGGHSSQGGACNLPDGWSLMGVGNYGGDPDIRIANLDTGVTYDNVGPYAKSPEFNHFTNVYNTTANIASATYTTPSILVSTNDNSDLSSSGPDLDPYDDNGHGTDTSHIHSAHGDNGSYISGIAWECSLIPVKVLPSTASCISDGIDYAVSMGADVINMSLGGGGYSGVEQTAVTNAWNAGSFVVIATGNDWSEPISYPAGYQNAFSVGAIESNGYIACPLYEPDYGDDGQPDGSNWGDGSTPGYQGGEIQEIDVVAGGGSGDTYYQFISYGFSGSLPTGPGDFGIQPEWGYVSFGTSYAAPVVSGVVALMKSKGATNSQIKTSLHKRANYLDFDPYNDPTPYTNIPSDPGDASTQDYNDHYGFGVIDASASIQDAAPAPFIALTGYNPDYNGDGYVEPGESNKDLVIILKNNGTALANNVTASVITNDFYTVLSNNLDVPLGSFAVSEEKNNSSTPINISISSQCPVPRDVLLEVKVEYQDGSSNDYESTYYFYITVGKFPIVIFDVDGGDSLESSPSGPGTEEPFRDALTALGFTYTYFESSLPADISSIETLFVCHGCITIGWGGGDPVNISYTQIQDWLDEGGKNLYFEGTGTGNMSPAEPFLAGTDFYNNYLRATYVSCIDWEVSTTGITQVTGQSTSDIFSGNTPYNYNTDEVFSDHANNKISANADAQNLFIASAGGNSGLYAVNYHNVGTDFKTIYQELLLGGFTNSADQEDYISKVMFWFTGQGSVPDNNPPATPTLNATLNAYSEGTVVLKWKAPGDDGWNGSNSGGSYDIRYVAGNNPGFDWGTAIDPGGEPTPTAPNSDQNYSIDVSTEAYYTFRLAVTDDNSNTVYSNDAVIYVEGWSSPGCETLASVDMVLLIEWIGDDSEVSINAWKTELSANGVIYDFYQDEVPADLSGYTTIVMVAGEDGSGSSINKLLANASRRQAVEDFAAAGGDVYFESDLAWAYGELALVGAGDIVWFTNVFGLGSNGSADFENTGGGAAALIKDLGVFSSQDFAFSAAWVLYHIDKSELGSAISSFEDDSGPQGETMISEYNSGTHKAILANILLSRISTAPEQATYVDDFLTYMGFGVAPPDLCEPTEITDLNVTLTATDLAVNLTWSAPGDDNLLGTGLGAVTSYEIRYSNSEINEGNWNSATVIPNTITPQVYGNYETFNSPALPSSGTYYFAIKSTDDQAFVSAISNCPSIYIPSEVPNPRILVYARCPEEFWWYYPYNGDRDDFTSSTKVYEPILFALDELGYGYDFADWDFPGGALDNYDVIFWIDTAFGPPADPDTGCLTIAQCQALADWLANGGRLYQEGTIVGTSYGVDNTGVVDTGMDGEGLDVESPHWKYFGIHHSWYRNYYAAVEIVDGMSGTWTSDMLFYFDASGGAGRQPFIMEVSTSPRGANAIPIFSSLDDPFLPPYDPNTPALTVINMVANDTVGAKTVISNVHLGGLSSYSGEFPSLRREVVKRILQFFGFGGIEIFSTTEPILFPSWSNDGRDVAFINGDYGSADIMIVEDAGIEGSPTTVNITNVGVTSIHHLSTICWDQNDQYLLYISSDATYHDLMIHRVLADNSAPGERWQPTDQLTDWNSSNIGVGRFIDPDVSHAVIGSSYKIAVTNFGELWAYNADGSGDSTWDAVQITDFQGGNYFVATTTNPKAYQPKWSPDDDSLVFVYRSPGDGVALSGIYILTGVKDIVNGVGGPAGEPPTTLDDARIIEIYPTGFYPCWSPSWTLSGDYIAFCMDVSKTFSNVDFWTNPDAQVANSDFDVYFRVVTLENNSRCIFRMDTSEGFEEWTYSGGDKYAFVQRESNGQYGLFFHGPEVLEGTGISRNGASKKDILIVNDHSKSYVKMSTSGYGDVKLSIRTPGRIKPNGTNGLTYVGEAREIQTYPGGDEFKNGAELVIHYTKQEAEGLKHRFFGIYYFDKTKNIWTPISGSVVTTYENGGYVSAKVYKQGTYAIFSGKKASAYADLTEMRTFPNPYRPNDGKALTGTKIQGIVIDRLPDDIDEIKVYNIAGDLVATSDNGAVHYFEQADPNWIAPYLTVDPNGAVAVWYGNNDNDKRVASGVYLITIKTTSGHEEVKKVAVIW